jgi:hypothetical protein
MTANTSQRTERCIFIAFPFAPDAYPKIGSVTGGADFSGVKSIVAQKLPIGLITFVHANTGLSA